MIRTLLTIGVLAATACVFVDVDHFGCLYADDHYGPSSPALLKGVWEGRDTPTSPGPDSLGVWWRFDVDGYVYREEIRLHGIYVTNYLYRLDAEDADTILSDFGGNYCPGIAHTVGLDFSFDYPGTREREYCDLTGWVVDFSQIHGRLTCGAREVDLTLQRIGSPP